MKYIIRFLNIIIISATANCFLYVKSTGNYPIILVLSFLSLVINIFPSFANIKISGIRLRIASDGAELLIIFIGSVIIGLVYHIVQAFFYIPSSNFVEWLISLLIAIAVEAVIFWNGIIRVYCTSVQLGFSKRVLGIVCGWVPIANVVMLLNIINTVSKEVSFETNKINLNKKRKDEQICCTKYPVLLVQETDILKLSLIS